MKENPVWSILIPTISSRLSDYTSKLINELETNIESRNIELLVLLDNQKRTIGGKRNSLIHIARGNYISFIDDDDIVSPRYVSEVYEVIQNCSNVDLITFNTISRPFNSDTYVCKYSLEMTPPGLMENGVWCGIPSHLMIWKYELIQDLNFPNTSFGEDYEWMIEANSRVKTCFNIDKILYSYEMGRTSVPKNIYSNSGDPFES